MRPIQVCMHEKHTYTVTHTHTHTNTHMYTYLCKYTHMRARYESGNRNAPTTKQIYLAVIQQAKPLLPPPLSLLLLLPAVLSEWCLLHAACRKHFSIFRLTLLQVNVTELDVHPIQSHSCSGHCSASRTPADSICCTERRSIMAWTWSRSTSNRMSRCASWPKSCTQRRVPCYPRDRCQIQKPKTTRVAQRMCHHICHTHAGKRQLLWQWSAPPARREVTSTSDDTSTPGSWGSGPSAHRNAEQRAVVCR